MKVMSVIGTRPEAIKMAPVIRELWDHPHVTALTCVTGQHREMLDQVLSTFDITPDEDLNLMSTDQDLFDITSRALLGLREVLRFHRPDRVLVHGDTTTSMAAAMAAFYEGVPVAHVEAGLRTFDLQAPFPEEFNRQVTAKIARYHFAPTQAARSNLLQEGVRDEQIWVTGNTVVDALWWTLDLIRHNAEIRRQTEASIRATLNLDWESARYILMTGHRRENFGQGLLDICAAVRDVARLHADLHVIYPVHPNPSVSHVVYDQLGKIPNVHLVPPLGYRDFLWLLDSCYLVITDSGGV